MKHKLGYWLDNDGDIGVALNEKGKDNIFSLASPFERLSLEVSLTIKPHELKEYDQYGKVSFYLPMEFLKNVEGG